MPVVHGAVDSRVQDQAVAELQLPAELAHSGQAVPHTDAQHRHESILSLMDIHTLRAATICINNPDACVCIQTQSDSFKACQAVRHPACLNTGTSSTD